MTVRPIIFSGGMVAALLAGRKIQTRRLATSPLAKCQPGDLLYVRETWAHYQTIDGRKTSDGRSFSEVSDGLAGYRADGFGTIEEFRNHVRLMSDCGLEAVEINGERWRPSIHMPRWASRLRLEVTKVRRQLLQEIDDEDALAEGVDRTNTSIPGYARERFRRLWISLHGDESWEANPGVIAISFRVHQQNIDTFLVGRAAAGDPDYWKATEGNAKRALCQLRALAQLRPDGVFDGD